MSPFDVPFGGPFDKLMVLNDITYGPKLFGFETFDGLMSSRSWSKVNIERLTALITVEVLPAAVYLEFK